MKKIYPRLAMLAVIIGLTVGMIIYTAHLSQRVSEKYELAQLLTVEADGSKNAMIAVGEVVMNRVRSNKFPNTIHEVITQPKQFTAALDGVKPSNEAMKVAEMVLNGERYWNDESVMFYRPATSYTERSYVKPIGNLIFKGTRRGVVFLGI